MGKIQQLLTMLHSQQLSSHWSPGRRWGLNELLSVSLTVCERRAQKVEASVWPIPAVAALVHHWERSELNFAAGLYAKEGFTSRELGWHPLHEIRDASYCRSKYPELTLKGKHCMKTSFVHPSTKMDINLLMYSPSHLEFGDGFWCQQEKGCKSKTPKAIVPISFLAF